MWEQFDNEIINEEVIATKSIYGDDIEFSPISGASDVASFSIKVVANYSTASRNFLKAKLGGRFPREYPTKPLHSITLELEGSLPQRISQRIRSEIESEATRHTTLYDLIDKLKEQLEAYNEGAVEGEFLLLYKDARHSIFEHLEVPDLVRLAFVSKTMRTAAEDNRVWKTICQEHLNPSEVRDLPLDAEPRYFKNYFASHRIPFDTMFVVRDRSKTRDEWPQDKDWRSVIRDEMLQHHNIVLPVAYGRINQISEKGEKEIGSMVFLNKEEGLRTIQRNKMSQEYKDLCQQDQLCPWAGKVVGFINFSYKPKSGLVRNLLKSVRGGLLSFSMNRFFSGFQHDHIANLYYSLVELQSIDWIVSPSRTDSDNPYLNDALEQLNKQLRFSLEGKRPLNVDPVPKEWNGEMYPFKLHPDLDVSVVQMWNIPKELYGRIWFLQGFRET
eukprot:TRINITY_DN7896_c0_g1_i1.p1 TRINITY_DN7896_c0_g1~~TRINITY_DN7896_c0_g1_i1.p1  ORF type:complete len:443 (+),score=118.82 TRINITY_DN7896_c0_g1_i1:44-1372(+)